MTIYAYYPGCSLEGTAKDFEMSNHEVFQKLGIELKEIEDWTCCGATSGHFKDHLLSIALPARNLALAKNQGATQMAVSCAACFSRMKTAIHELAEDAKLKAHLEKVKPTIEKHADDAGKLVDEMNAAPVVTAPATQSVR